MARSFNGSNQYLARLSTPPVAAGYPFTMACWFKTATTATQCLMGLGDAYDVHDHRHTLYTGGAGATLKFQTVDSGTLGQAETAATVSSGVWSHACGVLGWSNWRAVYLNGGSQDIDTTSVNPVVTDYFGIAALVSRAGPTVQYYLNGQVAEAAVWDVALTPAEIAVLAAGYPPPFVRPQSLKSYYPLIRSSADVFGNINYAVTEYNSPTVTDGPPMLYYVTPQFGQVITAVPSGTIFASSVLNSAIFSGTIVR